MEERPTQRAKACLQWMDRLPEDGAIMWVFWGRVRFLGVIHRRQYRVFRNVWEGAHEQTFLGEEGVACLWGFTFFGTLCIAYMCTG